MAKKAEKENEVFVYAGKFIEQYVALGGSKPDRNGPFSIRAANMLTDNGAGHLVRKDPKGKSMFQDHEAAKKLYELMPVYAPVKAKVKAKPAKAKAQPKEVPIAQTTPVGMLTSIDDSKSELIHLASRLLRLAEKL